MMHLFSFININFTYIALTVKSGFFVFLGFSKGN